MNRERAPLDGVSAALSRRQLLGRSAIALGSMAGASLIDPTGAFARANAGPRPIPGGFDASGKPVPKDPAVHVLIPGIGFEMATISNFTGVVAGSEARGRAHGSDGSTWDFDTDMRFMEGTYVGLDGRRRKGAFGFVWIDLYDTGAVGDPTKQRHDWEPGIAKSGLFWTIPFPATSIQLHTSTGRARFHARNVRVKDYHDIINAIQGGGPHPVASHVSFDVRWHGHGRHRTIRDKTFGFEGQYVTGRATVSFTASQDGGVVYTSDASGQYNPTVKEGGAGSPAIGMERNGVFFH